MEDNEENLTYEITLNSEELERELSGIEARLEKIEDKLSAIERRLNLK